MHMPVQQLPHGYMKSDRTPAQQDLQGHLTKPAHLAFPNLDSPRRVCLCGHVHTGHRP